MQVFQTDKGKSLCEKVIELGYRTARQQTSMTTDELDQLRLIADPLFGVEKVRDDELGDDPEERDKETKLWRKLEEHGLVEIVE